MTDGVDRREDGVGVTETDSVDCREGGVRVTKTDPVDCREGGVRVTETDPVDCSEGGVRVTETDPVDRREGGERLIDRVDRRGGGESGEGLTETIGAACSDGGEGLPIANVGAAPTLYLDAAEKGLTGAKAGSVAPPGGKKDEGAPGDPNSHGSGVLEQVESNKVRRWKAAVSLTCSHGKDGGREN